MEYIMFISLCFLSAVAGDSKFLSQILLKILSNDCFIRISVTVDALKERKCYDFCVQTTQ